jgi:hypothetical protein
MDTPTIDHPAIAALNATDWQRLGRAFANATPYCQEQFLAAAGRTFADHSVQCLRDLVEAASHQVPAASFLLDLAAEVQRNPNVAAAGSGPAAVAYFDGPCLEDDV